MTCFFDRNIPHHQLFSLSSQSIVFLSLWWSCSFQSYKYSICAVLCCSLEKAMAPHSSTLAWKIPWMEEPGRLQSMGSLRGGHDWATSLALFTFMALEKEMATHSSSCLESPRDRGAWWAAVYGVAQSQTQLKRFSSSSSSGVLSYSVVSDSVTVWTIARQAPLSMGIL